MLFDDIFSLYWDDKPCFKLYDKRMRTRDQVLYMLDRSQQIFVWEKLPDTIPSYNLEQLFQLHGNVCITEVIEVPEGRGKPGLRAFFGGLGGELDDYYQPTIYTVSNPYLHFNKELKIGVDCVRARNDHYGIGLLPLFMKYGAMLNENEISMNMLSICYRINELISADDDRTYESAKAYLNDIIDGKFGVISSSEFFDGIRNDKTTSSGNKITDLIEYEQYLKASWYNEIGLNSNYNMKRERIVSAEAELTDDALIPLVDNMLSWRLKACEDIKEMYGDRYDLDGLTVKLNAIWDLDRMYSGMLPETENETPEDVGNGNDNDNVVDNVGDIDGDMTDETPDDSQEETPGADINININISTEDNTDLEETPEDEEEGENEEQ